MLKGLILCGGQSLRMGSDKGLLKLQASTWAQTAADKMAALNIPVYISVNEQQYTDYATVFLSPQLVTDNSTLAIKGPLLGLLSMHLAFTTTDILVLACDMPLMEPSLLQTLQLQQQQQPQYGAYIYTNQSMPEPLCGIYTSKALAAVYKLLIKGDLQKHSMKYMLEHISVFSTELGEEQKKCFRNFNAHAQLNGL
ncbi:MAG: hypothetical protein RL172_1377 [Bacteroidota bacterium]|jgi:molybdenum cofactor guanylyltransferase